MISKVRGEVALEAVRCDCFLCRPNAAFIVSVASCGYVLAGVGPLCDGYAVVSTNSHYYGLGDASNEVRVEYANFAEFTAQLLEIEYGACFVIEHGNMAVCGISEEGREHCFHPHFLLIPAKGLSVEPFIEYFGKSIKFDKLTEAIEHGITIGQYVLAGPAAGPFHVFVPNGELPRQFARGIVAEQLGVTALASWRDTPNLEWTLENAASLKSALQK